MSKKEKIILATLDLASKYGLKSLSMSQIAESVGIKKPSLYNHFDSKETLIKEMYAYIREKSKQATISQKPIFKPTDTAYTILKNSVNSYKKMTTKREMLKFYKIVYAERTTNPDAAKIVIAETDKMVTATKSLFKLLAQAGKFKLDNPDTAAITFSMTIHSLIDYELDHKIAKQKYDKKIVENYIKWFCNQYNKEEI